MMVWARPADAVACFQHDHEKAGIVQRVRSTEAGGARADDGDIDFGGEGHELGGQISEWRTGRMVSSEWRIGYRQA